MPPGAVDDEASVAAVWLLRAEEEELTVTTEALPGVARRPEEELPAEGVGEGGALGMVFESFLMPAATLLDGVGGRGGTGEATTEGLTLRFTAGDSLTMARGGTGTEEEDEDCRGEVVVRALLAEGRSSPLRRLCSTTWWYCLGKRGGGGGAEESSLSAEEEDPAAAAAAASKLASAAFLLTGGAGSPTSEEPPALVMLDLRWCW